MKKVIGRQCRTVQILRQSFDVRQRQILCLTSENNRLRTLVKVGARVGYSIQFIMTKNKGSGYERRLRLLT